MFTITFKGGAQTTTGSMHLIEVNGLRILLDCGLYQGHRKEAFERNRQIDIDAKSIDCVLLSHAHIDHSGNLPSLVRAGFRGPIYTTEATRDLCKPMWYKPSPKWKACRTNARLTWAKAWGPSSTTRATSWVRPWLKSSCSNPTNRFAASSSQATWANPASRLSRHLTCPRRQIF